MSHTALTCIQLCDCVQLHRLQSKRRICHKRFHRFYLSREYAAGAKQIKAAHCQMAVSRCTPDKTPVFASQLSSTTSARSCDSKARKWNVCLFIDYPAVQSMFARTFTKLETLDVHKTQKLCRLGKTLGENVALNEHIALPTWRRRFLQSVVMELRQQTCSAYRHWRH